MSRCFQRLRVAQVKVNAAALHVECVCVMCIFSFTLYCETTAQDNVATLWSN